MLPENWPTVQMFVRLQTQWRTSAMGLLGLDYGVAFQLFDLYAVEDKKEMLDGLSVMEREALVAFSEEREQ